MLSADSSGGVLCDRTSTGAVYLDVDPPSFRFVLSVLSRDLVLDDATMSDLYESKVEWLLLKHTMEYLCLPELKKTLDAFCDKRKDSLEAINKDLNTELKKREAVWSNLGSLDIHLVTCNAFRKYCPGNRCPNRAVVISGQAFETPLCSFCNGKTATPCTTEDSPINTLADLVSTLTSMVSDAPGTQDWD